MSVSVCSTFHKTLDILKTGCFSLLALPRGSFPLDTDRVEGAGRDIPFRIWSQVKEHILTDSNVSETLRKEPSLPPLAPEGARAGVVACPPLPGLPILTSLACRRLRKHLPPSLRRMQVGRSHRRHHASLAGVSTARGCHCATTTRTQHTGQAAWP